MFSKKNIYLTLGATLLLSSSLYAQKAGPTALQEVLIEGNRIQVPFSQMSRDIQVITRRDIEKLPVQSINELLAYVPGVDMRQRGPFGTQADISMDGGSSEQTLVLLNGVKLLDAQTAHNMLNMPLPLAAIDHIEILRGAAARIYGINALTGAINIVTRKDTDTYITAGIQAGSSFQKKDAREGSGMYAGGELSLSTNLAREHQNHLLAISQGNFNGQRYNSAAKNTRMFYQSNFALHERHHIQTMAGYARSHFGANGFYAAPADLESEEVVRSAIFSLGSTHRWGNFTLAPRISDRYGEDDYRFNRKDLSTGRSMHYNNALMLELNSSLMTTIGTFGLGWESRLERINSSNIGRHQRSNHGIYAEWQSGIGEKFRGTLGVYANSNTDYGWQLYPGIDLAYRFNHQWKLSGSVGSGQRIPSFSDLYLDQRPGNVGNVHIRPENAWNYEGQVQFTRARMQLQAGYFFRDITNFIDWVRQDEASPYTPLNFEHNQMHGVYARMQQEIQLRNQYALTYHLSYNYLHPSLRGQQGTQSKYLLESLQHQWIAGADYQLNRLQIGMENRIQKREFGKAYYIADIRIKYALNQLGIYTQVNNLFDGVYTEAGAVPMPGRWFSLGLHYQWNGTK